MDVNKLGFDKLHDKEGDTIHFDEWKPPAHQHQYAIPVEWKEKKTPRGTPMAIYQVTKLRCQCGEETTRA